MRTITYLISGGLVLVGLGALAMPVAMLSLPQKGTFEILMGCGTLLFSLCCIAAGIQFFIKKDRKTALEVVGLFGFFGWLILNGQVMTYLKNQPGSYLRLTASVVSIVLCYSATKALKKIINRAYEKASAEELS